MPEEAHEPLLTERFRDAMTLAFDLHRSHLRKSTTVPYFSHLMSVSALVLEDGGDEDEAIAALLHDSLEDCADQISAEEIENRFGGRVRALVEACTDTPPDHTGGEKPDWKSRKDTYIAQVATGDEPHRVSLADKVHNARSILRDHLVHGESVWARFRAGKEGTLWYYKELEKAYRKAGATGYLIEEKKRIVDELLERTKGD